MSTPYPPQPRRLMRDPSNKLIGGVCSGLAKYLNMDVNLVRILTVVISLFTGVPIVLYIIALFVLPEERKEAQPPYVNGPQAGGHGVGYPAQPNQQPGQAPVNDVWGPGGAPWEQPQTAAPASPPAQQSWQQPAAWQSSPEPSSEPTAYDTAPADTAPADTTPVDTAPADTAPADTAPADAGTTGHGPVSESSEDAPATAAPEQAPVEAPEPEPVPETEAPQPAEAETSTWESAPADPNSPQDGDEADKKD